MSRLPDLMHLHDAEPGDRDLLFMIAQEHANEGRPAEALAWLSRYLDRGGDVGAAHRLAAGCHLRLGDAAAARRSLETGVAAALAFGHRTLAQELRDEIDDLGEQRERGEPGDP